jgi:hypothetical protein
MTRCAQPTHMRPPAHDRPPPRAAASYKRPRTRRAAPTRAAQARRQPPPAAPVAAPISAGASERRALPCVDPRTPARKHARPRTHASARISNLLLNQRPMPLTAHACAAHIPQAHLEARIAVHCFCARAPPRCAALYQRQLSRQAPTQSTHAPVTEPGASHLTTCNGTSKRGAHSPNGVGACESEHPSAAPRARALPHSRPPSQSATRIT